MALISSANVERGQLRAEAPQAPSRRWPFASAALLRSFALYEMGLPRLAAANGIAVSDLPGKWKPLETAASLCLTPQT